MSFDLQISGGDLVIGKNGDLNILTGSNKLEQDLLKIAITPAGGNVLQPWYGSLISKTLIGSFLKSNVIFTMAQTQLSNALENLKSLQNLQVSSGQKVTPDEQIASISSIKINRNMADPRIITVAIQVISRAFGRINTAFTVNP